MKCLLTISVLLFCVFNSIAQNNANPDSAVTTFLRIKVDSYFDGSSSRLEGFILTNIDTLGEPNWRSKEIKEFEKDGHTYFSVKANIPAYVLSNSREIWCTAIVIKNGDITDTVKMNYGGVMLSKIKLILKSTPEGAETYLIPNRIWKENFEKGVLDFNNPLIKKFHVDTRPTTENYARVDQTVFMIVYKMNDKYKTLIYHTKSFNTEPVQTVWINF